MEIPTLEILLRLVVAALLCGLIGLERGYRNKPAGIKTNALIGMGTSLLTIGSIFIATQAATPVSVDISRIAAAILPGIGFLGAGAIIQARGVVKGLTTAASIWVVAAIGMAVGMGLYSAAVISAIIVLVVLVVFRKINVEEEEENQKETHI